MTNILPPTQKTMHTLTQPIEPITLKAYGRNVQNIIHLIEQEPDKEKRTAYAKALIPIMVAVNPNLYPSATATEKAWQDLLTIAHHTLDIDTPYPRLQKDKTPNNTTTTPTLALLPSLKPQHRRYGRNILGLIQAAKETKDKTKISTTLLHIAQWILTFHRKNNNIYTILHYFQTTISNDLLPDSESIKQQLEALNIAPKHGQYRPKRFFRKKKHN